jgi:trehalose 6-phosphate phosphatase
VEPDGLLAGLRDDPARAALLLDVDGVLAPIVDRPEDARVPDDTRAELRRLAGSYGLVACVSGRASTSARAIVGLDELVYVGEHGLELDADAPLWRTQLRAFADSVDWPVEDKGLSLSFHYRNADDEQAAEDILRDVAERARAEGLSPRFGRKVLEIRPPVDAHKGTAVRYLLGQRRLRRALYAGDDTTDLDAFRALDEDGLELAVRVAVASNESPRELRESADVVVGTPAEFLETVLRRL